MFKYAQLNGNNVVVGISQLSGEVNLSNMIYLSDNEYFVDLGWKYINNQWIEPELIEPELIIPTTIDEIKEMQLTLMMAIADIYTIVSP